MTMLATSFQPDLQPIGDASFFAVVSVVLLTVLTRRTTLLSVGTRARIIGWAPWALLLMYTLTEGSLPGRAFPGAQHYVARALYVAFGLGFALHNFRLSHVAYRVNAFVLTLIFALLVVQLALAEGASLLAGWQLRPFVIASYVLVGAVWIGAAILAYRTAQQAGRRHLGLCPSCSYDMRATPGRCPECGTPTPART